MSRVAEKNVAASSSAKNRMASSELSIWAAWVVSTLLVIAMLSLDLPREAIGLATVFLVITFLLAGVPIGLGMIAASICGLTGMQGASSVGQTFQELVYNSTATWSMSVIPLFILMGIALWKSGITAKALSLIHI